MLIYMSVCTYVCTFACAYLWRSSTRVLCIVMNKKNRSKPCGKTYDECEEAPSGTWGCNTLSSTAGEVDPSILREILKDIFSVICPAYSGCGIVGLWDCGPTFASKIAEVKSFKLTAAMPTETQGAKSVPGAFPSYLLCTNK